MATAKQTNKKKSSKPKSVSKKVVANDALSTIAKLKKQGYEPQLISQPYIIEVKKYANAKALGQAIAYAALFKKKVNPEMPVIPVVITDRANATTIIAAREMGVRLWDSDGNLYD